MMATRDEPAVREASYGQTGLSAVDRFGVYLSRRAIERAIGDDCKLNVLDVGCGFHATLLRALLPRVERGLGIDLNISDEAKAVEKLRFIEATVEESLDTLPDSAHDLILMVSVLEHLWEPLETLRHLRSMLRPGGVMLVNVPTWLGKRFLEFSAFRLGTSPALEMDDHKMYYDARDLWPLLVRAGFPPSRIRLRYHKLGLNLFATARA